jgi:hypothetical protein
MAEPEIINGQTLDKYVLLNLSVWPKVFSESCVVREMLYYLKI